MEDEKKGERIKQNISKKKEYGNNEREKERRRKRKTKR